MVFLYVTTYNGLHLFMQLKWFISEYFIMRHTNKSPREVTHTMKNKSIIVLIHCTSNIMWNLKIIALTLRALTRLTWTNPEERQKKGKAELWFLYTWYLLNVFNIMQSFTTIPFILLKLILHKKWQRRCI